MPNPPNRFTWQPGDVEHDVAPGAAAPVAHDTVVDGTGTKRIPGEGGTYAVLVYVDGAVTEIHEYDAQGNLLARTYATTPGTAGAE